MLRDISCCDVCTVTGRAAIWLLCGIYISAGRALIWLFCDICNLTERAAMFFNYIIILSNRAATRLLCGIFPLTDKASIWLFNVWCFEDSISCPAMIALRTNTSVWSNPTVGLFLHLKSNKFLFSGMDMKQNISDVTMNEGINQSNFFLAFYDGCSHDDGVAGYSRSNQSINQYVGADTVTTVKG